MARIAVQCHRKIVNKCYLFIRKRQNQSRGIEQEQKIHFFPALTALPASVPPPAFQPSTKVTWIERDGHDLRYNGRE